jgi:hypothetical protein
MQGRSQGSIIPSYHILNISNNSKSRLAKQPQQYPTVTQQHKQQLDKPVGQTNRLTDRL